MDRSLATPQDEFRALEMCIGDLHTQTYSTDGTKLLIVTTQKEIDQLMEDYPNYNWIEILEGTFCTEFSYDKMRVERRSVSFTGNIVM